MRRGAAGRLQFTLSRTEDVAMKPSSCHFDRFRPDEISVTFSNTTAGAHLQERKELWVQTHEKNDKKKKQEASTFSLNTKMSFCDPLHQMSGTLLEIN